MISFSAAGHQIGGIWIRTSGTGGGFDAITGTFDCTSEATSSEFIYSVSGDCGTNSCRVNIYRAGRPVPGAGNDGEISVCAGNLTIINLYDVITNEQLINPMWTRISGTGGVFDPVTWYV